MTLHLPRRGLQTAFLASCFVTAMPYAQANGEEIRCAQDGEVTFLFAHGLDEEPEAWDTFASRVSVEKVQLSGGPWPRSGRDAHQWPKEVVTYSKYGIWRTQVEKKGHIQERGDQLADFMKKAQQRCGTANKSVVAVGHSMGGLDLRYIVGNRDERKLLKAVYTIATPHLGDPDACDAPGGIHDLCGHPKKPDTKSPMRDFNSDHPYSDFRNHNIAFTAFWYECAKKEPGEDGVVLIESQRWDGSGAPREQRGTAFHKTKALDGKYCAVQHGCVPELCQVDEIENIMALQKSVH